MTSSLRIEAARAALARAAWVRGQAPAYGEDAIIDLLADIRLWCQTAEVDFSRCDHLAWVFYFDEEGRAS
ncbi:hypothetical protein F4V91_00600 [Neorhizobium galegae]|uniref:Uncharacterized protein n=1 Tax=Neorhizobium galegae TaxID=399 RepID=A0A6A1TMA2_NEOGA|nr:hypothetical protein [Neorhizobium galegae]KAB1085065.1 hypothetical protein F4V91_00600 [Neorhizobium galegae]